MATSTKTKPRALILTTSEGHLSIAQAIDQALSDHHWHTHIYQPPHNFFSTYKPFYLFFPSLFKIPFKLANNPKITKALNALATLKFQQDLYSTISRYQPDLIITTWFLYLPVLNQLHLITTLPVLNAIPNPITFHPIELSTAVSSNLLINQAAKRRAQKFGVPSDKLTVTGWFVRNQFTPVTNKPQLRKDLHLTPDIFTVLVTSGSEGTNLITKISPAFIQPPRPVQVVFSLGHNRMLKKAVGSFKKLLTHYPKSSSHIHALPFTDQLHRYIQAADLVVGKAGPNTLFETIATHAPFFAITHISGQEDGNLEFISKQHLGFVEENPLKANRLLTSLIASPDKLTVFDQHIKKIARLNHQAPSKLVSLANQLIKSHPQS